jgi:hypothetical protein
MIAKRSLTSSLVSLVFIVSSAHAVEKDEVQKAIDRGVNALKGMQDGNGSWPYPLSGATSLAGIALLECDVPSDDKSIQAAAAHVRKSCPELKNTYSLALAVVFLDRLGEPQDVPLIESLMVRILAGQNKDGRWGYDCPPIGEREMNRLRTHLKNRTELKGGRELPKPGKRTVADMPDEIRQQLAAINRAGPIGSLISDNSNTQFVTLALWVGRRHGFPVESALARLEHRMRSTQGPNGSWDYHCVSGSEIEPNYIPTLGTPAMTAAGALALTVAHGAAHDPDAVKRRAPLDPTRDIALQKALLGLGSSIGKPVGKVVKPGPDSPIPIINVENGKSYYFLWALERLAVALNLETIGNKDWYNWGAEVLLANQAGDGTWRGEYGDSGADTCFALMFLRRANLMKDLSANLRGRLKDPATVVLKSGGVGGAGLKDIGKSLKPALAPQGRHTDNTPKEAPKRKPIPDRIEETESDRLSNRLVEASPAKRQQVLEEFKTGKGVQYTEALSLAISRLDGEAREKTRDTLAERLTRMSARQLGEYMKDENPEIRRGAVMAIYMKDLSEHVPLLIERLGDGDSGVARAAQLVLKEMTKQEFGPEPGADREERDRAIAAWKEWWRKQQK